MASAGIGCKALSVAGVPVDLILGPLKGHLTGVPLLKPTAVRLTPASRSPDIRWGKLVILNWSIRG